MVMLIMLLGVVLIFTCKDIYRVRSSGINNCDNITVTDVYKNKKGIVTIISDDGFYDTGIVLNQLLAEIGIRATVAGVVKLVDLYKEGWEKLFFKTI